MGVLGRDGMDVPNPLAWEDHFPPAYGHTSISFLKKSPSYQEAKGGDLRAALRVAGRCLNSQTALNIRRRYPDAVLLPVVSDNKLPEALALLMGLPICTEVRMRTSKHRKSLSGMERLLHKPVFRGRVTGGKRYIIVDDVITQGGTVSALRKYVIGGGGHVCAIVTLSYAMGSHILVPGQAELIGLAQRFDRTSITHTLRRYDIAGEVRELTRAQIRYLLLFKELGGLISKIEKTKKV